MNPLKRILRFVEGWIESTLQKELDQFGMFTGTGRVGKIPRRHKKQLISPSKRLIWGTELALLVFLSLVILQALSIVYLREFQYELMSAIFVVLSFLAGTYWGHRA